MTKRERSVPLKFYVTPEEEKLIEQNMALLGTENRSAFLRKMAIDGQVIKLDLPELKEIRSLLRHTSDNMNQLARRANANGRIYNEDIADMQVSLDRIWEDFNGILQKLSRLS